MSTLTMRDNWPNWKKILVIAALLVPALAWVVFSEGTTLPVFLLCLAYGLGVSALGGYWLADRTWLLVPLLAMGLFLTFAIPAAAIGEIGGETPFSMIVEAPFWAGAPAFIGALVGAALRTLHDRPR